jgi:ribonuclease D
MCAYNRNPTKTIAFDPTSSKYCVNFAGKSIETTVTDRGNTIDEWVHEILSLYEGRPTAVGLDIEWRPHQTRLMSNKSATLQLCIDEKCLIVQLFYTDYIPQSLKSFMMDPNFTFVGVEVGNDIAKLNNDYGVESNRSADIRELAMRQWPGRFCWPGLKDLAFEVSGLSIKKPQDVRRSNWEARVLNENQVEYACIDAYASYRVGQKLLFEIQRDNKLLHVLIGLHRVSFRSMVFVCFVLILFYQWCQVSAP